jgi:antitoxin component YwqK of YwqJK toxin-antitoxin module
MKQRKSDIPHNATEVIIREYHEDGPLTYLRLTECILNGQVVGQRAYDSDGNLRIETPLKNGKKHGREYIWGEDGALESVEPYVEGKLHGLAKQYGRDGNVIGTYRCIHGTGYDIWRHEMEDGSIVISEIHSLQDGLPHGYEWWLKADQHSVWHERYWQQGRCHGIERIWNDKGRLKRDYPKFWIQDQAISKRVYLKATEQDKTLPKYRETENRPQRQFPVEIENLFLKQN